VGAWLSGGEAPHGWLLAGDVANAREGIDADAPKPWAYRTFVVPESEPRQGRLRRFLREAARQPGLSVMVSHDAGALADSSLPAWGDASE